MTVEVLVKYSKIGKGNGGSSQVVKGMQMIHKFDPECSRSYKSLNDVMMPKVDDEVEDYKRLCRFVTDW